MPTDQIPGLDDPQLPLPGVSSQQEDLLSSITRAATRLVELNALKAEQEKALEKTESEIKDLSERALPIMMTSVGLESLNMRDGHKIKIKPEYFANISKARAKQAFEWLRQNNSGSIIKEEITVPVALKEMLAEAEIPFESNESVHSSTLRAFVKERIEANDSSFPRELFGVHVSEKAVVN